ncbi:hypothetical protein HYX70_01285 [Candidatus Saccharibacteria bacterium]|nr:hypothetical protein [Candidatus Saccharibacteria bacterium]
MADDELSEQIGNICFWLFLGGVVLLMIIAVGYWLADKIRKEVHHERERRGKLAAKLTELLPEGSKVVSTHWRPGWNEGGYMVAWVSVGNAGKDAVLCRLDYYCKHSRLQLRSSLPSFEQECEPGKMPAFLRPHPHRKKFCRRVKTTYFNLRTGSWWFVPAESDGEVEVSK